MMPFKRGAGWPIAITAILGLTVGLNVWVMRVANADPSMVVESDYYRKAIRWDDEMAQARRNAALGWTLRAALAPVGPSERADLHVAITDSTGAPISGARVTLEAFAITRSASVITETLAAARDGYAVALPVTTPGRWELRFTVERDGERFTSVQRLDAVRASVTPGAG